MDERGDRALLDESCPEVAVGVPSKHTLLGKPSSSDGLVQGLSRKGLWVA